MKLIYANFLVDGKVTLEYWTDFCCSLCSPYGEEEFGEACWAMDCFLDRYLT